MTEHAPEYYRNLGTSTSSSESSSSEESDSTEDDSSKSSPTTRSYRADAFRTVVPEATWRDQSVHSFTGPIVDDVEHVVSITTISEVDEVEAASELAEQRLQVLADRLDGFQLLIEDALDLECGHPARRAIFVWFPEEGRRLYQEQLYVLHDETGYVLSAGFTANSRKQIGEEVEHVMRQFRPVGGEQ